MKQVVTAVSEQNNRCEAEARRADWPMIPRASSESHDLSWAIGTIPVWHRWTEEDVFSELVRDDRFGFKHRETATAIIRNGSIDDRTAIEALPGIEHHEEIGKPLQHHQSATFWALHRDPPG
jgi:hypothetical protein